MTRRKVLRYWNRIRSQFSRVQLPIEHWGKEHYIPLLPNELLAALKHLARMRQATQSSDTDRSDASVASNDFVEAASEPSATHDVDLVIRKTIQPGDLDSAATCFKQLIRLKYRFHHEKLMDLYSKYDPDRDVFDRLTSLYAKESQVTSEAASVEPTSESSRKGTDRHTEIRTLFAEITDSLYHANYRRLSPQEIQSAIGAASHWGVKLRIRFSSFRRLEVYARGDILTRKNVRHWKSLFRPREIEVPIYQRLVVIFWPKDLQALSEPLDPRRVHIRMFKNVPKADIDMMLPGTQVRLNWLDRGMIGIPTLWGIFMMSSKLVKSIWVLAFLGTLKILSSTLLFFAIVIATAFYGIKSFFSYSSAKRRYLLDVTRNLYYQNLDNNLGALLRIEEEAEQQEVCEAIMAYFVLKSQATPLSSQSLDEIAERYLAEILGSPVDFDVDDAIRDLVRLDAIQFRDGGWVVRESFAMETGAP